MKFKAFILFLSILAYVGGWLAMPARMVISSEKTCCAGAMKNCPKKEKRGATTAYCCLDCPLCYVTVMPSPNEANAPAPGIKKVYPSYQSIYKDGYHADAWKPPATA